MASLLKKKQGKDWSVDYETKREGLIQQHHARADDTLRRIQRHDALVWPQQFWKSSANGSNIILITQQKKCCEFLAQVQFDQFQTSCSNSEKHATTQQVIPNIVGVVGH